MTSALKKISVSIESGRKNIENDTDLVTNIVAVKTNFNEIESVIKNQIPSLESMKQFSNQVSSETSKNLEIKRFFTSYIEKSKHELKQYLEVVK